VGGEGPVKPKITSLPSLAFWAYNAPVYWLPIILPFTPVMDYNAGFIAFFIVVIVRAFVNFYRNNFLTLEQAERFPLRIPG